MQGPRLPSHFDESVQAPRLSPPRVNRVSNERERQEPILEQQIPQKPENADWQEKESLAPAKMRWHQKWRHVAWRHLSFIGPGVIASVAYIDPGNWATDLQAGSRFGYSHLFIILFAGLIAALFQVLSTRLGCVSDLDLASHCRLALHDRPRHKMFWRWGVLYPLYVMAEIGIIFTDLAELLGSAIAINLIVPAIPLYGCVLLTSLDVFLILLLFNQYPTRMVTRSMRMFELLIGLLVLTVLASFVALLIRVSPVWKDVFRGYVPSSGITRDGGIFIAVGIVGATVMPHAFFIGSKMATMRRLRPADYGEAETEQDFQAFQQRTSGGPHLHLPQPVSLGDYNLNASSPRTIAPISLVASTEQPEDEIEPKKKAKKVYPEDLPPKRPSLTCVKAHLAHSIFDIIGSLLGFAVLINSAILILAAAVFYYGEGQATGRNGVSDLFDAFALIREYLGSAFAYLFAVALFCAGQSASLTVTLSGQIVSEGMIRWRTTPWKRRLITRLIGIIPSLAVAVSVGREGIDVLLVGSQVALSIVLTFVLVPLIIFTAQNHVMSIPVAPKAAEKVVDPTVEAASEKPKAYDDIIRSSQQPFFVKRTWRKTLKLMNPIRRRPTPEGHVSFANAPAIIYLTCALWTLITIANVFALIQIE